VGIPPAPRGVPQIEVTFDIDANGIVHVSAKDLGTGKEQKIRIESSSGLSEDEIKKMVKDAEMHAEEDKKEREKAETLNEADNLLYSTEKSLKEFGDKVTAEDKQKIEAGMEELRTALKGGDIAVIKTKVEALRQASYKLAEEIYRQAGSNAAGGQAADTPQGDNPSADDGSSETKGTKGTAEDVDYEVVDEDEEKK
jgi:molecular chaperone DnaK